jgi:hypothetical protein
MLRRRLGEAGLLPPLVNRAAQAVLDAWHQAGILDDPEQALALARGFAPGQFDWRQSALWFEASRPERKTLLALGTKRAA